MIKNYQNSMKSTSFGGGGNYNSHLTRILAPKRDFKTGFSLMEMMVVLLIISIIMAATAPLVAKKMKADRATGGSPWIYTSNDGSIGYNLRGNGISVLIGASKYNPKDGPKTPRLVLAGDNDSPAFVFAKKNGDYAGQINMTDNQVTMNGLANGSGAVGENSVAIGMGQTHNASSGTVAIGQGVDVNAKNITNSSGTTYIGENNIAIGYNSVSKAQGTIAIGPTTRAYGIHSISIGNNAWANTNTNGTNREGQNDNGIAIGNGSRAKGNSSVAIGLNATATGTNSVAIGQGASTSNNDRIELGTSSYTVHIPGNLVVNGNITTRDGLNAPSIEVTGNLTVNGSAYLARNSGAQVWLRANSNDPTFGAGSHDLYDRVWHRGGTTLNMGGDFNASDRRLKNVGTKYISGLDALKKLDIYNFTFKNDKNKTPHVGVIAQDLEKVFPTAVTKDVYGYLHIRWDEMFYAVINAVKELDTKLTELSKNVQSYLDETKTLKATVAEQQNTIAVQQNTIDDLVKRIEKLEKKEK